MAACQEHESVAGGGPADSQDGVPGSTRRPGSFGSSASEPGFSGAHVLLLLLLLHVQVIQAFSNMRKDQRLKWYM